MDETERYSTLIGDIYDAALDPSLWLGALEKSASFVRCQAAGFFSRYAVSGSVHTFHHFGVDPRYTQLYLDRYAKLDPTRSSFFFFDIGQVVSTADVMPYQEFRETRFYEEWARPQGW